MSKLVKDSYDATKDRTGFLQFFLEVIEDEADKAEQDETATMSYYKVFGKSQMGHLSPRIGYKDETIKVDDIIISGKSMYRVWINLYKYCYSISKDTTYKHLFPQLDDDKEMESLYPDEETTINDIIDKFLETMWDDDHMTDGRVQLFKVKML
jgi:hypothetical protein